MEEWYRKTQRTWGDLFDSVAERFPSRDAIVDEGLRWSYAELRRRIDAFARGLLRLGIRRGDHVALWMTNCPEWVVAQFAVYKIGAVLLPVYTRFKESEVAYALKQSDSSTLILNDKFLGKIDSVGMLENLMPELARSKPGELRSERLPKLRRIICLSEKSYPFAAGYSDVLDSGGSADDGSLAAAQSAVDPFDPMNIIYTSGTTGFPKGGLSMHRNNMASIYNVTERMRFDETHRCLLNLPLFSNFGCMFVAALAFLRGASIIIHESFDAVHALETIEKEKITHLFGSPALFISYIDEPSLSKYDRGSLVGGIVGGSPLPPKTMIDIIETLGAKETLNVYGLSECGGLATAMSIDDPIKLKSTTVGTPLPNCRVKVANPENGEEAARGKQGEICLHDAHPGSSVGKGYYNMPDKTREAIDDGGWFHTGDLGVLGEDGYLRVTGRVKDMFLVGGFNVYPVEIENVLHAHPKIKQAQVIGVPDHRLGEVGMAFVELKPGEEATDREIADFANKQMANFKAPKYVKFVKDFPLTGSGKVRKFLLREQAIKELGLKKEYEVREVDDESH